jgi:hypothetical protein
MIERWNRGTFQWVLVDSITTGNTFSYAAPSSGYPDGHFTLNLKASTGNDPITEMFGYYAATSKFKLGAGDSSVVVDFGWPTPGTQTVTDLILQNDRTNSLLETTLINTRFVGISDEDRVAACGGYWMGGLVLFGSKVTFAPRNCVALIANTLGPDKGQQPNAQGKLGTVDRPALSYVTGTVEGLKGALEVHGVLISLCDINSQGGPDVYHDPSVLDCIPQGVLSDTGAGFLHVEEWREVGL